MMVDLSHVENERCRFTVSAAWAAALVATTLLVPNLVGGEAWARAKPKHLHVAPWGKDSWPGSAHHPFATLQRAQRSVRASTDRMKADVIVNLHAGTHWLAAPLRLSKAAGDSGENGHSVIYRAYGSREVTISGGRPITGWRSHDLGRNVWKAHVGALETRQLYVDGRRARRARLKGGGLAGIPGNVTATATGYVTDSTAPQSWSNPGDVELVWLGQQNHTGTPAEPPGENFKLGSFNTWTEPRCGIAEISGDAESTVITMDQPCYRWFARNNSGQGEFVSGPGERFVYDIFPGFPTHAENSLSFLTEPGTFYIDRSRPGAHVLYYIPRAGEDLNRADVVAPVLERLVDGRGDRHGPLTNVTFRGLTFADATWLAPGAGTGFAQMFGPIYEGGDAGQDPEVDPWDVSEEALTMPGNVSFRRASGIKFDGNRFTRLGGTALELSLGSTGNMVEGNVVSDVSGGGIQIGNRYPSTELDRWNPGNVVANNVVRDIGVEYRGSIGIYAEAVQSALIEHNQVDATPYTGIAFGEYWTDHPEGETTGRANRVLDNRIFDTMNALFDGGGIWTVGPQGTSYANGASVRGNLIHDTAPAPLDIDGSVTQLGFGLFPDDGSRWVEFRGNVLFRNGWGAIGGCMPLGPLQVVGNFWDNDTPGWACEESGGLTDVTVSDNTLLEGDPAQACAAIPACARVTATAGLEPRYRHLLSDG